MLVTQSLLAVVTFNLGFLRNKGSKLLEHIIREHSAAQLTSWGAPCCCQSRNVCTVCLQELERWLSSSEHFLLLLRTCIWVPSTRIQESS